MVSDVVTCNVVELVRESVSEVDNDSVTLRLMLREEVTDGVVDREITNVIESEIEWVDVGGNERVNDSTGVGMVELGEGEGDAEALCTSESDAVAVRLAVALIETVTDVRLCVGVGLLGVHVDDLLPASDSDDVGVGVSGGVMVGVTVLEAVADTHSLNVTVPLVVLEIVSERDVVAELVDVKLTLFGDDPDDDALRLPASCVNECDNVTPDVSDSDFVFRVDEGNIVAVGVGAAVWRGVMVAVKEGFTELEWVCVQESCAEAVNLERERETLADSVSAAVRLSRDLDDVGSKLVDGLVVDMDDDSVLLIVADAVAD